MRALNKSVLILCMLCPVLIVSSCSTSTSSTSEPSRTIYLAAGQIPASELPHIGRSGSGGAGGTTTIPLAQQNPLTELFQDMSEFQACLQTLGVKFIGVPDQNNPNSPTNSPTYLKALQTCAAQSNIVQALKDVSNTDNNMTPSQIRKENKMYIAWRKCMIGKGWQIPTPTPNSKGELFALGSETSGVTNMTPPPGQSILSSGDMQACAQQTSTGN